MFPRTMPLAETAAPSPNALDSDTENTPTHGPQHTVWATPATNDTQELDGAQPEAPLFTQWLPATQDCVVYVWPA